MLSNIVISENILSKYMTNGETLSVTQYSPEELAELTNKNGNVLKFLIAAAKTSDVKGLQSNIQYEENEAVIEFRHVLDFFCPDVSSEEAFKKSLEDNFSNLCEKYSVMGLNGIPEVITYHIDANTFGVETYNDKLFKNINKNARKQETRIYINKDVVLSISVRVAVRIPLEEFISWIPVLHEDASSYSVNTIDVFDKANFENTLIFDVCHSSCNVILDSAPFGMQSSHGIASFKPKKSFFLNDADITEDMISYTSSYKNDMMNKKMSEIAHHFKNLKCITSLDYRDILSSAEVTNRYARYNDIHIISDIFNIKDGDMSDINSYIENIPEHVNVKVTLVMPSSIDDRVKPSTVVACITETVDAFYDEFLKEVKENDFVVLDMNADVLSEILPELEKTDETYSIGKHNTLVVSDKFNTECLSLKKELRMDGHGYSFKLVEGSTYNVIVSGLSEIVANGRIFELSRIGRIAEMPSNSSNFGNGKANTLEEDMEYVVKEYVYTVLTWLYGELTGSISNASSDNVTAFTYESYDIYRSETGFRTKFINVIKDKIPKFLKGYSIDLINDNHKIVTEAIDSVIHESILVDEKNSKVNRMKRPYIDGIYDSSIVVQEYVKPDRFFDNNKNSYKVKLVGCTNVIIPVHDGETPEDIISRISKFKEIMKPGYVLCDPTQTYVYNVSVDIIDIMAGDVENYIRSEISRYELKNKSKNVYQKEVHSSKGFCIVLAVVNSENIENLKDTRIPALHSTWCYDSDFIEFYTSINGKQTPNYTNRNEDVSNLGALARGLEFIPNLYNGAHRRTRYVLLDSEMNDMKSEENPNIVLGRNSHYYHLNGSLIKILYGVHSDKKINTDALYDMNASYYVFIDRTQPYITPFYANEEDFNNFHLKVYGENSFRNELMYKDLSLYQPIDYDRLYAEVMAVLDVQLADLKEAISGQGAYAYVSPEAIFITNKIRNFEGSIRVSYHINPNKNQSSETDDKVHTYELEITKDGIRNLNNRSFLPFDKYVDNLAFTPVIIMSSFPNKNGAVDLLESVFGEDKEKLYVHMHKMTGTESLDGLCFGRFVKNYEAELFRIKVNKYLKPNNKACIIQEKNEDVHLEYSI